MATPAKYALTVEGHSNSFCRSARPTLKGQIALLPEQTAWACTMLLEQQPGGRSGRTPASPYPPAGAAVLPDAAGGRGEK